MAGAALARPTRTAASDKVATAPVPAPTVAPHLDPAEPARLSSRLQGGAPLPPSTRMRMEASFGQSFADVRVHTGGAAAEATNRHRAEALTVGRDVAFAPGRFTPQTPGGDHLIAHELAHVVQQRAGGGAVAQPKSLVSNASDSAEIAADAAANQVAVGGVVAFPAGGLNTRGRIMRRARMGAGGMPAMSIATPTPGASRAAPSPVMTGLAGANGDKPAVAAAPTAAPGAATAGAREPLKAGAIKGPDEAQTALPAAEAPPPSVAVAGATAGAAAEAAAGPAAEAAGKPEAAGEAAKKKEEAAEEAGKEKEEELDEKEKEAKDDTEAAEEGLDKAKAKKKKRKFGQVPGDRGAKAARAAAARTGARGGGMASHDPADKRVGDAQAAAEPPANEGASRADGTKVGTVSQAEPPPPDPEAARAALMAAVEDSAPATLEELDDMESRSTGIGTAIAGNVSGQVSGVTGTLDAVNETPAPEAVTPAVPQPPGAEAPATADPNLAAATPPAVPDESLDASEFKEEAESTLEEQDIDDATLAKANEAPLAEVAKDKQELDEKVEGAGDRARGDESAALTEANDGLAMDEAGAVGEMASTRGEREAEVLADQDAVRGAKETEHQSAADRITAIADKAQEDVNAKLDTLTDDSTKAFDDKQQGYLETFKSTVRSELDDFKDDRYSGAFGWARWLKDKVVSINELDEVKALYERNRDAYIENVNNLILDIVGKIDQTIADCRATLETARTDIQTIIDTDLPEAEKAEALKAQQSVDKRFAALETQIKSTQAQAFNALTERRKKAIADVDRALDEIKAENEALLDKIVNFVKKLIDLLGKFLKLLTRITRMGVGSFISAALGQAKDGVQNHLWGALQEAFKQWVFSKIPFLEPLLSLPPNWMEMMTALAVSLPDLFMQHLPEMLPAIGAAAMIWLATNLAAKLIPGAGAIMAIIDGIRAAIGLVQSLLSAAGAFFDFVMKVADGANGAADFAAALARGIVAGLAALLTFLGVDALIRRVGGAIAKPFGRIFGKLKNLFKSRKNKKRDAKKDDRGREKREREKDRAGDDPNSRDARKRADDRADRDRRGKAKRRDDTRRRRADDDRRRSTKDRKPDDPKKSKDKKNEKKKEDAREKEREARERLEKAVREIQPKFEAMIAKGASRIRIKIQLAIWRARYRLSQLSLEGGTRPHLVAAVNPKITFSGALDPTYEDIFKMVLQIGRARYQSAKSAAREKAKAGSEGTEEPDLGAALKADSDKEMSLKPGDDPQSMAVAIRERESKDVPKPKEGETGASTMTFNIGEEGVSGIQKKGVTNVFIAGLGTYPEIQEKLASKGLTDVALGQAIEKVLKTGEGDVDVKRLVTLMFGTESARSDIGMATAPLAATALTGDKMSSQAAFGSIAESDAGKSPQEQRGGGGLFPPSQAAVTTEVEGKNKQVQPGFVASAKRAEQRADQPDKEFGKSKAQKGSDEVMRRTYEFIAKLVDGEVFKNMEGLQAHIRKLLDAFDARTR